MKRFALAGNPNCGKTTLFNALTGSTAHVGNWPGVTVDKKEGVYKKGSEPISIIDLPGIYSLSPYTPEEVVSRNYILDEKPDCVINIVDATNLERNLYLTTQVMEMDVPIVIALNMMDALEKQGDKIDEKELTKRLGVPVVKISALKGTGIQELMEKAIESSNEIRKGKTVLEGCEIWHLINDVRIALDGQDIENPLFHAIKLVENDEIEVAMHQNTIKMVEEFKKTFENELFGTDFEALVADARYKYISKYYSPLMSKKDKGVKLSKSDKADKVLTNKWVGIPIFLAILFAIFHLTFSENFLFLGGVLNDEWVSLSGTAFEGLFGSGEGLASPGVILFNLMDVITATISGWLGAGLESITSTPWVLGLVNDGILAGLCGVLSFVPQIIFLLLCLSILEDTGYMARVAFILDRIFRRFGVSGRAFIPMIMGFGCSIPAMVNTRTLADERERTLTIRAIPFFTCGAKLPILAAVTGAMAMAFNIGSADLITYALYVVGMAVAVITILIMRGTTQRGEIAPFIMELPAYHAPGFKGLMIHLWDKTKHYVKKVFTIILASTIIIWFVSNFRWDWTLISDPSQMNESILASVGKFMQPIFTPLGFGSQLGGLGWVFAVAAILGLIAKENVIAGFLTLASVILAMFTVQPDILVNAGVLSPEILSQIEALIASGEFGEEGYEVVAMIAATGIEWPGLISFIVFNMTTIPCFAAVATAKGELGKGKIKWTLLFWIATSFIASAITYVFCTMFATWSTWSIIVSIVIIALMVFAILGIRAYNEKRPLKSK
ncbi:MAG: ferrous iron transporter B [Clostridia bacterium]|nr:ferrous iron transporter B [Clostridia bacterium]